MYLKRKAKRGPDKLLSTSSWQSRSIDPETKRTKTYTLHFGEGDNINRYEVIIERSEARKIANWLLEGLNDG